MGGDRKNVHNVKVDDKKVEVASLSLKCVDVEDAWKAVEKDDGLCPSCVQVVEKFDTCCSRCMSGVKGRLKLKDERGVNAVIKGFNGSQSYAKEAGWNKDGKYEFFVSDMKDNLVLLCANQYASEGAAVLFRKSGLVVKMTDEEVVKLEEYLKQFEVLKELVVRNRTYEVAQNAAEEVVSDVAFSSTATRYFNTKVHVSNDEEMILAMMLTGLSYSDLYGLANRGVSGLPRELTKESLNRYSHRYGVAPDVVQLATPNLAGNTKGYFAPPEKLERVGQRVEADYFVPEFNMKVLDAESQLKKTAKIPTFGNAIAAYVSVDVFTGYVHGHLVMSLADPLKDVKVTVEEYSKDRKSIELFAADQGIVTQSQYHVIVPEVVAYLTKLKIAVERAEAHSHDRGGSHVERAVRTIKELIRFAVLYVFNNPNFSKFGFTKMQIFQLWGELFHWAVCVMRLKRSRNEEGKSKYEAYHGIPPDLRGMRLLPIFSVVSAERVEPNKRFWQRGLYVGPSLETPGSVKVAIITRRKLVRVITTSKFKAVSDGGDLDPYQTVERAVQERLISSFEPVEQLEGDRLQIDEGVDSVPADPVHAGSESRGAGTSIVQRGQMRTPTQVTNWPSRSDRAARRNQARSDANQAEQVFCSLLEEDRAKFEETLKESFQDKVSNSEESCFVDWTTHGEEDYYYSYEAECFVSIEEGTGDIPEIDVEEGYKAVTQNVPKNIAAALKDSVWGPAARKEFDTITQGTGALVKADQELARRNIRDGANCLIMLAVYEEKIKEGEVVKKVRMVLNGSKHDNVDLTYAPTPSR